MKPELNRIGMPEHAKHSRVCRTELKVNTLTKEEPRKKAYGNRGFGKIEHQYPPSPFVTESSFKIGKPGISASAFANIFLIDRLGDQNGGIDPRNHVSADRRRKEKKQLHIGASALFDDDDIIVNVLTAVHKIDLFSLVMAMDVRFNLLGFFGSRISAAKQNTDIVLRKTQLVNGLTYRL